MSAATTDPGHPGRILVVSADMGEGHNATARALEQRARTLWPGCDVRRIDTLQVMGPGVGPLFRRIYVTNVQWTPWLYELFYASLERRRWFATASKRFVGAWCGRRLVPVLVGYRPDLIVSTYPLGSAGLDWLRRGNRSGVPTGAWISDFAPHPFWVYSHLDAHLVMHEVAVPLARAAVPEATVDVCAPPVVIDFAPRDRRRQRVRLGLDPEAFLAVVSCGALGFGTVEAAVDALLAAQERVQVVAVCGRNAALRQRLQALGHPTQRLLALGWLQDMPAWTSAADVVVTNAGGATALEALASQRALIMFDPIAAHGRANAELMARAGLALLCRSGSDLTRLVGGLVDDRRPLLALEAAAAAHLARHDLDRGLLALAARRDARPDPPHEGVRAQDAFFLHVDTPTVAQQVGTVLVLEPASGDGPPTLADLRAAVAARLPELPTLRRRLVQRRGRATWCTDAAVDLDCHLHECPLPAPDEGGWGAAVDEFFSAPLDRGRALWQMRLVSGLPGGRCILAIKVHHSLGDGLSVVGTLSGLLDPRPARELRQVPGPPPGGIGSAGRNWTRTLRGLSYLVLGGTAPASPLNGTLPGPRRHIVTAALSLADLRRVARRHSVRTSELAVWAAAAGVHRMLAERDPAVTVPRLRAMIPVSQATARRTWGNWTGALPADLAMGSMPEAERLALVSAELRRQSTRDTAYAAAAVLRFIGTFPPPVHRGLARLFYRDRWFNLILSFMPGAPTERYLAGARLAETYPVLPLAEGVGLSIGLLTWAGTLGIGITADPELVPDADRLGEAIVDVFAELACQPATAELAAAAG